MNTTEKDLFAFKINYDSIVGNIYGVKPLYNGNISETYWRTTSDNVLRKYGYAYDNLNRLTNAFYQKPGGNNFPTYHGYGESNITYDKNGNIKTLSRTGDLENALPANVIDQLSYSYKSNSNQLTKVLDHSNNTSGFNDGNLIGDDYSYDANGNMITDKNKGITEIIYNHLNLPTKITFGTKGTINYIYNSMGVKIEKTVYQAPKVNCGLKTTITTDYLSGFQYMKTANSSCTGRYALPIVALQFFPTTEGYVKNTNGVYSYVFNYTDHLGNVRVSYEKDAASGTLKILEENNYYPFGMKHSGYNSNNSQAGYKYRYNSKEYQDELGLNFYDYGARNYDPALGRWMNIDPLAEKYPDMSPYNFCMNNPLRFIDPDGREADDIIVKGKLAQKYVDQLNSSSSLKITRNEKTGKLSATGEAKTEHDIQLLNAIKDEKITVNINATDKNKKDGKFIFGDSFDGSQKKKNGVVVAKQTINPNQAEVIEEFVGMDKGSVAKHGTLESYFGAQQSPGAYAQQKNAYLKAHDATNLIYPAGDLREIGNKIDFNVEVRKSPYSKTEVWMTKIGGEKPLFE